MAARRGEADAVGSLPPLLVLQGRGRLLYEAKEPPVSRGDVRELGQPFEVELSGGHQQPWLGPPAGLPETAVADELVHRGRKEQLAMGVAHHGLIGAEQGQVAHAARSRRRKMPCTSRWFR